MGQEQRQGPRLWQGGAFGEHTAFTVPRQFPADLPHSSLTPGHLCPAAAAQRWLAVRPIVLLPSFLYHHPSSSASRALPQLVPRPHPGLSLSSCSQPGLSLTSGRKPQQTPMEGLVSSRGRAGYIISGTQNKKKMTAFCILYILSVF